MDDVSMQRGLDRIMDTLDVWGPVCAALIEAERAMREARFILLGGGGSLLERTEQAVQVLEAGVAHVRRVTEEDEEI